MVPAVRTVHGRLHDLLGLPVFLGLPIACFVFSRVFARLGERGWAIYSALSGFLMFVAFVLAGMGFSQNQSLVNVAGGFQRLSITIGWNWMTLLAVHLLTGHHKPRFHLEIRLYPFKSASLAIRGGILFMAYMSHWEYANAPRPSASWTQCDTVHQRIESVDRA